MIGVPADFQREHIGDIAVCQGHFSRSGSGKPCMNAEHRDTVNRFRCYGYGSEAFILQRGGEGVVKRALLIAVFDRGLIHGAVGVQIRNDYHSGTGKSDARTQKASGQFQRFFVKNEQDVQKGCDNAEHITQQMMRETEYRIGEKSVFMPAEKAKDWGQNQKTEHISLLHIISDKSHRKGQDSPENPVLIIGKNSESGKRNLNQINERLADQEEEKTVQSRIQIGPACHNYQDSEQNPPFKTDGNVLK